MLIFKFFNVYFLLVVSDLKFQFNIIKNTLIRNIIKTNSIHNIPKLALFIMSAHVLITRPCESTTDWLKLKPFKLNAIVEIPKAVMKLKVHFK